jgi:hypothetical protein
MPNCLLMPLFTFLRLKFLRFLQLYFQPIIMMKRKNQVQMIKLLKLIIRKRNKKIKKIQLQHIIIIQKVIMMIIIIFINIGIIINGIIVGIITGAIIIIMKIGNINIIIIIIIIIIIGCIEGLIMTYILKILYLQIFYFKI